VNARFVPVTVSRLPLAVFFLALAPRLAALGRKPFWLDEITTAHRAALPLPALIRDSFINHHTPVYFLLVAPFAHLPDAQFWLRFPSAILGALNVMLVFLIAARADGRTAGIAAALILGLAPTEIAYSQEARSYMLMIFFLLIALYALIGLAQSGERAALPWRTGGLERVWLQFIAGSAAAICTLGDGLPWLLAVNVSAGAMIYRAQNRSGLLRNFLAANAIILACCLPLYLVMLHLEARIIIHLNVPVPKPALVWYDIESIYLMRVCDFASAHFIPAVIPPALTVCIGVAIITGALGGIWRLRPRPMTAVALLSAALTLPVLFGAVSIWKPLLTARYFLWSGPPFAILAGIGFGAALHKWPPPARLGALTAAASLLAANLFPFYSAETKPRWDIAAKIFAAQAKPQDVAYYYDLDGGYTMRYYLPPNSQPHLLFNLVDDLNQAEQARRNGRQVWAIYGDASNSRPWMSLADFQATLAPLGPPSAEWRAGSRIVMWVYDPVRK